MPATVLLRGKEEKAALLLIVQSRVNDGNHLKMGPAERNDL